MSLLNTSSSNSLEKSESTGKVTEKSFNGKNIHDESSSGNSERSSLVLFNQKSISNENSLKSSIENSLNSLTIRDNVESSKESFRLSKKASVASLNSIQDSSLEVTSVSQKSNGTSNKYDGVILKTKSLSSKTSHSNIDISEKCDIYENNDEIPSKVKTVFTRERNLGIKKQSNNINNEATKEGLIDSVIPEKLTLADSMVGDDNASKNTKSEASEKISDKSNTSIDSSETSERHESEQKAISEKNEIISNKKLTSSVRTVSNKLLSKNSLEPSTENISEKLKETEKKTLTSMESKQINSKAGLFTSNKRSSSSSKVVKSDKENRISSADTMKSVRSLSPDFKDSDTVEENNFDHKKFLSTLKTIDIKQDSKIKEIKEAPEKKVFKNKVRDLILERFGLPHHLKARMNASLFISGAVSFS